MFPFCDFSFCYDPWSLEKYFKQRQVCHHSIRIGSLSACLLQEPIGLASRLCSNPNLGFKSLNYEGDEAAVLQAYEPVSEAHRQKQRISAGQTYVELSREKGILFNKWCSASKENDFDSLRELVFLEDFKKYIPYCVVLYLN